MHNMLSIIISVCFCFKKTGKQFNVGQLIKVIERTQNMGINYKLTFTCLRDCIKN